MIRTFLFHINCSCTHHRPYVTSIARTQSPQTKECDEKSLKWVTWYPSASFVWLELWIEYVLFTASWRLKCKGRCRRAASSTAIHIHSNNKKLYEFMGRIVFMVQLRSWRRISCQKWTKTFDFRIYLLFFCCVVSIYINIYFSQLKEPIWRFLIMYTELELKQWYRGIDQQQLINPISGQIRNNHDKCLCRNHQALSCCSVAFWSLVHKTRIHPFNKERLAKWEEWTRFDEGQIRNVDVRAPNRFRPYFSRAKTNCSDNP